MDVESKIKSSVERPQPELTTMSLAEVPKPDEKIIRPS